MDCPEENLFHMRPKAEASSLQCCRMLARLEADVKISAINLIAAYVSCMRCLCECLPCRHAHGCTRLYIHVTGSVPRCVRCLFDTPPGVRRMVRVSPYAAGLHAPVHGLHGCHGCLRGWARAPLQPQVFMVSAG